MSTVDSNSHNSGYHNAGAYYSSDGASTEDCPGYVGGEYPVTTEMINLPPHAYTHDHHNIPSPSYNTTLPQEDLENQFSNAFENDGVDQTTGKPWVPQKKPQLLTTLQHNPPTSAITSVSRGPSSRCCYLLIIALFLSVIVFPVAVYFMSTKVKQWHTNTMLTINIVTTPPWETIFFHDNYINNTDSQLGFDIVSKRLTTNITPSTTVNNLIDEHLGITGYFEPSLHLDVYAFPDHFRIQNLQSMLNIASKEVTPDYLQHLDRKFFEEFDVKRMHRSEYIYHRIGKYKSLKDDTGLQLLIKPRERKINVEHNAVKNWFTRKVIPSDVLNWFAIPQHQNEVKKADKKVKPKNKMVTPVSVLTPSDIKELEQQREIDEAIKASEGAKVGRRSRRQLVPLINDAFLYDETHEH